MHRLRTFNYCRTITYLSERVAHQFVKSKCLVSWSEIRLRSVVLLLLSACLLSLSFAAQAQYRWPTMQFEVFEGNPYTGNTIYEIFGSYDWLETEGLGFSVDDDVVTEVELAFHEAAVWYQKTLPMPGGIRTDKQWRTIFTRYLIFNVNYFFLVI